MKNEWMYLTLTSLLELFWVYGFNVANKWWHFIIVIAIIIVDFHFLSMACKSIPTGTVYAIFAAAGTLGTALMDIFIFDKSFSVSKGFFMLILLVGVLSLKLADNKNEDINIKEEGVR
ncbi:QacE family quaternary ammonium compound efflux SMR transporter [Priestia megaterium]|nr:QacE family quaternary ammonium compound efflux SMR transporter [Priestia megaterium]